MLHPIPYFCKPKSKADRYHSSFFKYLLTKQQIQQMSLADEDNGLLIFQKFKNILFGQNEDDQLIINRIRQQPLKVCGAMIYQLTNLYNQKLNEIVEPLEQQKYHLQRKLKETLQRLQHYMDENQFLKANIDRLQEEKKQAEDNLNESIHQFQRSRDQITMQIHEREKIKSEVWNFYHDHQQIFTQNSQLQLTIQQYQKIIQILKQQNLKINTLQEELIQSNRIIQYKYQQLLNDQSYQIQQIQILNNKLCDKQQQIASMHEDYNKIRLFNQEDTYNQICQQINMKQSYHNQLFGFNFNNYQKSQNISQKSMSKNSSLCNLDNDMDQKFVNVNATAEKNRPKISFNSVCQTQEKKGKKIDSKFSSKQKNINSNYIKCSRKIQLNIPSSGQSKKKLIKTVSSKNFQQDSAKLPSASQGNDSKMMEQMLKKKLNEKNTKILRMQSEIKNLREGIIEQRQRITIIQGQYELQIQEINDLLVYTKKQLASLYQRYAISCAQCQMFREKAQSLQQQLTKSQDQHKQYYKQLKKNCKEYIIHRINQIQQQHNNLKIYWQKEIQALNHIHKDQEKRQSLHQLGQFNEENQYNRQQFLLQFKQSPQSSGNCKIDSFSQIQSYVKLQNHYINGFDLQLSSKLSYCDPYNQQIYVQQQFQIQSDLGRFTERIINERQYNTKQQQRGNFTDRCYVSSFKDDNLSISASQKPSNLSFNAKVVQNCIKSTHDRSLMIWSNINEYYLPINKEQMNESLVINFNHLNLESNLYSFTNQTRERQNQLIREVLSVSFTPLVKPLLLKSNQISLCYGPRNKNITLSSKLYTETILPYSPKLSLNSFIYNFNNRQKLFRPLVVQSSYNLNLQISKNRSIQLVQKTIDINEVIKRNHPIQLCLSPFQSLTYSSINYFITTYSIFQKYPSSKVDQQAQANSQVASVFTQYQEDKQVRQYCVQVNISEDTIQNQTQTDKLSLTNTTLQTDQMVTSNQQSQTISVSCIDFSMNTESINEKLSISTKQFDMIIQLQNEQKSSESFYNQKSILTLVRIPSFTLNFTNQKLKNSTYRQFSAFPPSTICSSNLQSSPKNAINSTKNIYEQIQYQIGENHTRQIQELYSQQQEKCHKYIDFIEENLSTKNDQNILQLQDKPNNSINRRQSLQQNLSPNYLQTQQKMDLQNTSILNKGVIYSKNISQEGKTFNPQSKSYRNHRLNQTVADVSPFFEQNKFTMVPQQIVARLTDKSLHYLEKHLQKTKARLIVKQIMDKKPFIRPNTLKQSIYLFFCKNNEKVFLVSSYIMIDLTTGKYLQIEDNHRIDDNNFKLGQSQVRITKNAQIIINRCDKKNKIPGTISDGKWSIEYYLTCKPVKRKLTSQY